MSFITAHARNADPVAALGLLREMKLEGIRPPLEAFSSAMDACLRANNPDLALALASEMRKSNIEPDEVAFTMIVRAYGLKGQVRKAALLVASLQREATGPAPGVKPGPALYNALLVEAVKSRSWAIADGALDEVLAFKPSDATYAALAAAPIEDGSPELHGRFLFEAVRKVKDAPLSGVRIAGQLYAMCLSVALAAGGFEEEAAALIASRRRGEVRLRPRDEGLCVGVERAWENRLGRIIEGSEWEAIKLFEEGGSFNDH